MKNSLLTLSVIVFIVTVISSCVTSQPSTQIVLLGESNASGAEAVQEANNKVVNAAGSGCEAISVGGYGAGGEGLVIGVPVLVKCPVNTRLLPDGTAAP